MADEHPIHRSISADELLSTAHTRSFCNILFPPDLVLDEADLSESRFERCLFRVPLIRGVDFSGSIFEDCRFAPTRFASCKLPGTRFTGCTLFDVEQKKGSSFAFCDLQAAEMTKCNFATCSFERCDLYNVHAVECSFRGVQFGHSSFTKALSRRSTLARASFDGCNFSFGDLSGLQLQNCQFLSCKFSEASFIDTDLSDAMLSACQLDRVEWDRAKLRNADLRGSRLSGLNLAVLADYAGLTVSESEQSGLLEGLGIAVQPD
ncbi:Pentapeptide repeat-containing protein [Enhydrobacter aerosaccus]|uniref:Pentapeptide repeat-containing protein n=1 Tax=Enhydrobacter aerosaccus TaxID=225324 RepID=A0A1T4PTR1_9HYPH|nr:pentapeptide repeat-containing protein [Enhydrobacter aerosaccus]SJZ94910.1 Pentapeptide repeat-containing protein [Enhydrobacter aerosaccus]